MAVNNRRLRWEKPGWGSIGGRRQEQEKPGGDPDHSQDKGPLWSQGREKP